MPLVNEYSDSSDSNSASETENIVPFKPLNRINLAPQVLNIPTQSQLTLSSSYNIPYEPPKPIQGPLNPFDLNNDSIKKNLPTGFGAEEMYDSTIFEIQRKRFQNQQDKESKNLKKKLKRIKLDEIKQKNIKFDQDKKINDNDNEDEDEDDHDIESDESDDIIGPTLTKPKNQSIETTEFYGSNEFDYLGRTYMHIPQDLDISLTKEPGSQQCFIPKKLIHTFPGHNNGVTSLQFIPNSGHLLLSGGSDSKIKIWDIYHNNYELLRINYGHFKPIKDLSFNSIGDKFLSSSFDKKIKLWDTETGKCLNRYNPFSLPNCLKFNPLNNNEFITGLSNNKILQYDLRLSPNEIIQTYDHHLNSVNSLTFVDNNQRFMSTSSDGSIRVWEWQINVPIKFISDPSQFSISQTILHPSGKYIAGQAMNNNILVFGATNKSKFRQYNKKSFNGHNVAGYNIQLNFSPDGSYLMSGDSNGFAWFWDWKTCKILKKLKIDDKPILCITPNPQETSKVAMAGLGGRIFYYD